MTSETVVAGIVLGVVVAAPALPLHAVITRWLWQVRSLWVLSVLVPALIWLAAHGDLWLSLLGLWWLIYWPQREEPSLWMPSAASWAILAVLWLLLGALPRPWLAWAPWGWLVIAWMQSGLLIQRKWCWGRRQSGTLGSPVLTAQYLALVAPFCPWWGWPLLAAGLVITWSWRAFLGLAAGLVWYWPSLAWPVGGALGLLGVLWIWSPLVAGRRLWEWTPRGDTFDSVVSWMRNMQLVVRRLTWRGEGPESMEPALMRWGTRHGIELTWGDLHCEPLQLVYEYGGLAALALGAFLLRVGPGVWAGVGTDPWAAAWVAGAVMALMHWPLRHPGIGTVWLVLSHGLTR